VTDERPQRLMLLDTASLYFRAFYGLPDSLRAPDGTPVNAVRGLLDFVATLASAYRPNALAACWDNDWRPQWRVDLLPTYKAHRVAETVPGGSDVEETPDPLEVQVPVIAEALRLLGVAVVGCDGYEADDVIGTLATTWEGPVDVVTGDRDLFQLVDDDKPVRVLYTARGVGKHERIDAAVLREKYAVEPGQYVDFAVLRGDPSDGLPGVAGIGDKTAATLLRDHGDLAGIRAAAANWRTTMTPRVRTNIVDGAAYLDAAVRVVSVACDIDDVTGTDLRLHAIDDAQRATFEAFAEKWGLGGASERVLAALDAVT